MNVFAEECPNLAKVVQGISTKSPFQKKSINRFLEGVEPRYFRFAEDFVCSLVQALDRGECHEYLVSAYLDYVKSIRVEEMYFARERRYQATRFLDVHRRVYSRDDYMVDYVTGLGMTQLFWPNHWAIVTFFLDRFLPRVRAYERGAEVGCGHGLFHAQLLRGAPRLKTILIDISPISLTITRNMIKAAGLNPERIVATLCDVQKGIPVEDDSLDVLLMGEIIEHLEEGEAVMTAMAAKMKPKGICYFTTAANAPAEDHILLFRSVGEIHDLLNRAGWDVCEEQIGTVGGMSVEEAEKGGHNINYAAILTAR